MRETSYSYDAARRLTEVGFDTDGDETVEETVSYAYDAGGLRTTLTLPGDLTVTYRYDQKGQLVSLTDWDDQVVTYAYDLAGRLVLIDRTAAFRTRYRYDAGGRLRLLKHVAGGQVLGHFAYAVDALGNRVSAYEALPRPGSGQTTIASDDATVDYYRGSWTTSGALKVSEEISAGLRIAFFGDEATLTLGVGPEYGICDVYVNGMLWRGFDNYAASAGEDAISLVLQGDGPHILEVKNRAERNQASTGYKVAFKSLVTESLYDLHTIQYSYDGLSRLESANYFPGGNVNGAPFRQYGYVFDLAGNRTSETVTVNSTPTTANYTYNAANQISNTGFAYDDAGRMTSDGTHTYTWDRANRLLSMGGIAYAYDGLGNRLSQTVNSIVTEYLNDVQPGLVKVLAQTVGSDTTRFVHGPRGIQAVQDSAGWTYPVQDGLGSVRGEVGVNLAVNGMRHLAPYGDPFAEVGVFGSSYGFTGEQTDENHQVYLRARYYNPDIGVFPSLDPVEGLATRPTSLDRYSWVESNPINAVDPSGRCMQQDTCTRLLGIAGIPRSVLIALECLPPDDCGLEEYVDRIAAFARQEANQEADQLLPSAAAIALAEINAINVGNNPRSRAAMYSPYTRWVNAGDSENIHTLAARFVEGWCSGNLPQVVDQLTTEFPILSRYDSALEYIARNPSMMYEHSFVSNNIMAGVEGVIADPGQTGVRPGEDFPMYARDSRGNILEAFKAIVIRGSARSIVVSNDFSPVPLEWNCPVNQNAVVNASYDPNLDGGEGFSQGLSCETCSDPSARRWWWINPDTLQYEDLDNDTFQSYVNPVRPTFRGGSGWVKGCS